MDGSVMINPWTNIELEAERRQSFFDRGILSSRTIAITMNAPEDVEIARFII
jgi:hypothetical protein